MPLLPIILVALLLLFILTVKSKNVASVTRPLGSWVASHAALLGWALMHVANLCKKAALGTLHWPAKPEGIEDSQHYFAGVDVIMRLLYLALSICLLLGELPLTRLRSAYLFGLLVTNVKLPLDVFTGLLWILIPAMWGVLLLETVGLVPIGVSLFPTMQLPGRKWLIVRVCIGVGSAALLAIALYATYNFYLLGQCQVLQLTCANDAATQLTTVGMFGVLLIFSGAFALWALLLGILGLSTIVFGVLSGICYSLAFLFGLAGHSVSTFGSPIVRPFSVPLSASLPTSTPDILLLPQAAGSQPQQEDPMNDVLRTNTFIGYGDLGYRMVPMTVDTAQETGAASTLLAVSMLDLERIFRNQQPLNLPGHDISPSLERIKQALADESMSMAYTQLAYTTNDEVVKAHTNTTNHGGNIIIFVKLSLIAALSEPIRKLKMRLRKQNIVLVTMLPPLHQRNQQLDEAYQDFLALGDDTGDDTGMKTFTIDPNAGFAAQVGEETQEKSVISTLLNLCTAPLHDDRNPTFAEICKDLGGANTSLAGMAFAMAPVASGKMPFTWRMAKTVAPKTVAKAGDRGTGDYNDLLIQAKDCTEQVLHNTACLATPYPIDPEKPVFLLYSLPMALQDKRFKEAVAAIHTFLKRTYPHTIGIIVRGSAVGAPGITRGYRCGVSALYPLPITVVTTNEEAIADAAEYTATPEETPPASQNGSKRRQSITS